MGKRLYVLVGVGCTEGKAHVVKYGPTSESRALLNGYDMQWPHDVVSIGVLPVLPGALLRVSQTAVNTLADKANQIDI
jgi:hypothetical protein